MTQLSTSFATAEQLRAMSPPMERAREEFTAPLTDPVADTEQRLLSKAVGRLAATRPQNVAGKNLITRRGNRYYANFTSPFDQRRVRDALCPPGQKHGTTDPVEAARLAQALWLEEYEKAELRKMGVDVKPDMDARTVVEDYLSNLLKRVARGEVGVAHARQTKHNLQRLIEQTSLGSVEDVRAIRGPFIRKLVDELRELTYFQPVTKKAGLFSDNMIRQHMAALSGVFQWLRENGHVEHNPLYRHSAIPSAAPPDGGKFLEVHEAAALIQLVRNRRRHYTNPFIYEIVMVLLYTGARIDEVMSMQPDQVDFAANVITVRGTKTHHSKERRIPLWPPLRECLERFFAEFRPHAWPLLFPRRVDGPKLHWRKRRGMYGTISRLAQEAGIKKHVTHHFTRHTYASARLTMVQRNSYGQLVPTPPEVVRLELGHSPRGEAHTLEKIYSHALNGPGIQLEYLDYELACNAPKVLRGIGGGVNATVF